VTAAASIPRRGRKAAAAERAAKERRERILVGGLLVVLVVVLAYELPKVMSSGGSSSPPAAATSAPPAVAPATAGTSPTGPVPDSAALRKALRQPPHDIFVGTVVPAPEVSASIPTPAGLHDPFSSSSSPGTTTAPAKTSAPAIKGTIVIGTPGGGTVAEHGWIVILASIPTGDGRAAAERAAAGARGDGIGNVSILNSSNRKPLRGGYWVVYTGPFPNQSAANQNASDVHAHGNGSAYIRQLIVYKKKS